MLIEQTDDGEDDMKKGTQLLEIYALEIQMYTAQKNNKKLKVNILKISKCCIPFLMMTLDIKKCWLFFFGFGTQTVRNSFNLNFAVIKLKIFTVDLTCEMQFILRSTEFVNKIFVHLMEIKNWTVTHSMFLLYLILILS